MTVLPDVVAVDLDILFCGTAPGTVSARRRAYYAGPGNAFWPTLFAVGLTPRALLPQDYAQLLQWNLGVTDLAKQVSGSDCVLERRHFDRERLNEVIARYRPRVVAFTGKRAALEFTARPVAYGLLPESIGATRLFVLPSPSGAARRYWQQEHWHELAQLRVNASGAGRVAATPSSIATPVRARSSAG